MLAINYKSGNDMKKTELIEFLNNIEGDPDIWFKDGYYDNDIQELDEYDLEICPIGTRVRILIPTRFD